MIEDTPRLIEVAFPLKQASLDSVHEKNVRHGHISTLHIWPARRPLAASRAALIATLLPDPGTDAERREFVDRLGGRVVKVLKKSKLPSGRIVERLVDETVGGILHWGRESSPDVDWFRQKIREAYGGRAPRVLDPFAGGGAIPLEAMRLGCDVTASDINSVAWLILKCTLEYPQRMAGQNRPLPRFALKSTEFMHGFLKSQGKIPSTRRGLSRAIGSQMDLMEAPDADLAWHVRAWAWWVLQGARADLDRFYPVVDGKPTVAYLWARTVSCKNCRAAIPLLKTLWLCRKPNKRVLLILQRNAEKTRVAFGIQEHVPQGAGGPAARREHDRRLGAGTMSKSGSTCPCCSMIMTMEDIKLEGQAGRLGTVMTAVIAEGRRGKEYRLPTREEPESASQVADAIPAIFANVPYGLPEEPTPSPSGTKRDSTTLRLYGATRWMDMFSGRQLAALGQILSRTRAVPGAMHEDEYPTDWIEAVTAFLAITIDKLADYLSTSCTWHTGGEKITHVFVRYALPMNWDFAETNPLSSSSGSYTGCVDWVARVIEHTLAAGSASSSRPVVQHASATGADGYSDGVDLVLTDPPYYDAIPYSNLMDFFYIWLRRTLQGFSPKFDAPFVTPLAPKWDRGLNDGELVDDPSRFDGDFLAARQAYEDGMLRAFQAAWHALLPTGRMVVVFANKQPEAWESLVSAMVRAGFVVDGSWPITTEMGNRMRAQVGAALASSVWLVCRKRRETARLGWDTQVLEEMRSRIYDRLRDFWDAGIRGPDFVWAATGPALEAYSKHPVVKKADEPNSLMSVAEFLRHVRRIVVDYVVGRILTSDGPGDASSLDDMTVYYLLHRNDFGLGEAPVGASILYAQSCNLRDRDLVDRFDLLAYGKGKAVAEVEEEDEQGEEEEDAEEEAATSGNMVRLKRWDQRRQRDMGLTAGGRLSPLIDQVHRMMQLWRAGDVQKVDAYLEDQGLRRSAIFPRLLQALIELARKDNQQDERALLESVMNHVMARGPHPQMRLSMEESS